MRAAIVFASAAPLALSATCWLSCACASLCPVWGAVVCTGVSLAAAAVIFVTASIARELHGLARHRRPVFRTEGFD